MEGVASVAIVEFMMRGNEQGRNVYARRSRIENLPDELLLHILSFLPTEDVVRTSLLAKRWQHLWNLVSHVDIEEKGPVGTYDIQASEKQTPGRVPFMNFVESVLLLRDSSDINYFALSLRVLRDASRINNWVFAALTHKVQKLCLNLSQIIEDFELPGCLFSCQSLTQLKIAMLSDLELPSTIFLPRLEELELQNVTFSGDSSANRLFSGCPNLKKLNLEDCNWSKIQALCVSVPKLEELLISDVSYSKSSRVSQVVIVGADLNFFSFTGDLTNDYCLCSSALIDGCLNLESTCDTDDIERRREVAYRAHKLLWQLAGVKSLTISPETLEVLGSVEDLLAHLPSFPSLVSLNVNDAIMYFPSKALLAILHKSPQLGLLDFDWGFALSEKWHNAVPVIDPIPSCFSTHLKIIRIKAYTESDGELYILSQLLGAASVLEKLYIFSLDLEKEPEIILRLYRQSQNCQIILSCTPAEVPS